MTGSVGLTPALSKASVAKAPTGRQDRPAHRAAGTKRAVVVLPACARKLMPREMAFLTISPVSSNSATLPSGRGERPSPQKAMAATPGSDHPGDRPDCRVTYVLSFLPRATCDFILSGRSNAGNTACSPTHTLRSRPAEVDD